LALLKTKRVKGATAQSSGAGQVRLRVKARGGAKKRLIRRGKAKVAVQVSFSPVGGTPSTATKKIKLVRQHRKTAG
jgi:hypothetical protein